MNAISPIYDESTVEAETILALDQPEYIPLVALRLACTARPGLHAVMTRWEFTDAERAAIANGAHLIVSNQIRPNEHFPPLCLQIVGKDDKPSLEFMK